MQAGSAVALAALVVAVDIGLARLGYGLLLPAIRAELGGPYAVYGAIGAAHLGGYLGGTVAGARFARNRARLPLVVVVTHLAVAAALVWSALAPDPWTLGVARALAGIASGVGIAAVITDALERVAVARRGLASGIAWAGIGVGLALSAPSGAFAIAEPMRWREVTLWFAGAALVVAICGLLLRAYVPDARANLRRAERAFAWRDVLTPRYAWFVGAYACFGIAYISYATFAVAAFAARGITGPALTAIWVGYGVASSVGSVAIGWVLSGPLHRFAMAIPLASGAMGCLVSELAGVAAAIGGAFTVGVGQAATAGVASAFARDRSDAATAARAFAAVTTCFGVGQLIGPLASGAFADAIGPGSVSVFAAAIFGLGAALALVDAVRARIAP